MQRSVCKHLLASLHNILCLSFFLLRPLPCSTHSHMRSLVPRCFSPPHRKCLGTRVVYLKRKNVLPTPKLMFFGCKFLTAAFLAHHISTLVTTCRYFLVGFHSFPPPLHLLCKQLHGWFRLAPLVIDEIHIIPPAQKPWKLSKTEGMCICFSHSFFLSSLPSPHTDVDDCMPAAHTNHVPRNLPKVNVPTNPYLNKVSLLYARLLSPGIEIWVAHILI